MHIYAVGRLIPQLATTDAEKEIAQLSHGAHQGDQVNVGLLQELVRDPDTAYIGRHVCLVFTCEGLDTWQVLPRDNAEMVRFIDMLSPEDSDEVMHAVVGTTVSAPINSPCAGLGVPAVLAEQVLAFTLAEFAANLPSDETAGGEDSPAEGDRASRAEFEAAARRLFVRLTRRGQNRGVDDGDKALDYLALRYAPLYRAVWQAQSEGKNLVRIDAQHRHSADRRLVSVRLKFRQQRTDMTEMIDCVVDTTGVFPYMVRGLQPVYD